MYIIIINNNERNDFKCRNDVYNYPIDNNEKQIIFLVDGNFADSYSVFNLYIINNYN